MGNYRDFFTSSAQLSSCAPQTGLGASAAYQGYLSECQSANSLARATTGEDGEAHWVILLDGVPEQLPVSRRQWPAVKEALGV